MNRSAIDLADSDASDQPEPHAKSANSDSATSASDDNESETEYVYIDPVDDPADEEDDDVKNDDSCIELPDTPLQNRADELVNRYLRRATQSATPVAAAAMRQARVDSAAAIDSAASSDSGQATIGTTPAKSFKSTTTDEPLSQGSSSTAAHSNHLPLRRSVRLKSVSLDSPSRGTTPSRKSSYTPMSADELTVDEVCVSSSSQDSSRRQGDTSRRPSTLATHSDQNSSGTNTSGRAAATEHLQRRLQTRVHRMSIDQCMATLSVSSESTNAATAAASANESTPRRRGRPRSTRSDSTPGPSPRKQRARTPSAKCLESFNLEDLQLSTPLRTARTRTPCKRYGEGDDGSEDERRSARRSRNGTGEQQQWTTDNDDASHGESAIADGPDGKSTMLYDHEADVAGQQMFAFRTPKKRNGMAMLAGLAPQTPQTPKQRRVVTEAPQTPKTPRNGAQAKAMATKTPSRVRSVLKRELAKFNMPDTSGTDFSADESDEYKPDASDSDDDDNEDEKSASESSDESSTAPKAVQKKRYVPPVVMPTPSARSKRLAGRRQQDFVPECEDYFTHHTNKKAITSDRTLDRMKTPRLPQGDLFKLLAATSLSAVHEQAVADMHREHQQHFAKWRFVMSAGFNILLHGLGSKRNLLQQFHQDVLGDQTVLVVNGFFPSLTIKDVLDSIAVDILELTALSRNQHEVVDAIAEELSGRPEQHVFLIVHNIDGVMLRNHKAQLILSRLAKVEQIHMIASMDHINAPLLWDHIKLSNFNFSWWDTTTMLPYTEETAFENSMLVNSSGGLALSSMKNVFLSLTQNSRGIFLIIVRNQLENKGNANFQGMAFKELYSRCRENFLVSSDVALRSQLTEFIDHHLVKMRRTSDGIENLVIPLDGGLLQQFLELQENND